MTPRRYKPHITRFGGKWRIVRANTAGLYGSRLRTMRKRNRIASQWAYLNNVFLDGLSQSPRP